MSAPVLRAPLALLLLTCAAGCDQSAQLASRYVKQVTLTSSAGGTIAVTAQDSTLLAGTTLQVAPGDLVGAQVITLEEGPSTLGSEPTPVGPAALWGPATVTFTSPVTMQLPFTLAAGQSVEELRVVEVDGTGAPQRLPRFGVTFDTATGLARFTVRRLAAFQVVLAIDCSGGTSCPEEMDCLDGQCNPHAPCTTTVCTCDGDRQCNPGFSCQQHVCVRHG